jgi:hypothetical protein
MAKPTCCLRRRGGGFSDGKRDRQERDMYGDYEIDALIDHGAPREIRYWNNPLLAPTF